MEIVIDLPALLYFTLTVVCGLVYGIKCYRDGVKNGADELIDYLDNAGIICVDEETGEISKAR